MNSGKRIVKHKPVFKLAHLLSPLVFIAGLLCDKYFHLSENEILFTSIGIAVWVISWWILEPIPIIFTSLLPLLLLPLTGILSFKVALSFYHSNIILLFLGGFLIGYGVEKWGLHERIALSILKKSGSSTRQIVWGIMLSAYLVSMWISNTATAIMLLPIAMSVFKIVDEIMGREKAKVIGLFLMLSIAYGANIGGCATIIGTPPNLVFRDMMQRQYGYAPDFFEWMLIGVPFSFLFLWVSYKLITSFLFQNQISVLPGIKEFIDSKFIELGSISKAQKRIFIIFCFTASGWILSGFINRFLASEEIGFKLTDEGIALFFAATCFLIPSGMKRESQPSISMLLSVKDFKKIAWYILFLFGGGMSMAKGLEQSGFVDWVGSVSQLVPLHQWWLIVLIFIVLAVFMTEFMSNVALTSIITPLVFAVSVNFGLEHPFIMGIPVTLAASLAFMMPISTPPNAVAFSSRLIPIKDMVKTGIWLNLLAVLFLIMVSQILKYIYA
jgi:solute carrier family 13 (sodium-dependent dicarboxylate transporter), member 2/3/5